MAQDDAFETEKPILRQSNMLALAEATLESTNVLISEVELLLKELKDVVKFPALTGLPTFIRTLEKEKQTLRLLISDIADASPCDESLNNIDKKLDPCVTVLSKAALRWNILKKSHSLVAMGQSFQGSSKEDRKKEISALAASGREKQQLHKTLKDQGKVEVDVVDRGREWIDIRPIQVDRLARQMTDSGWAWGEHDLGAIVDEDEWADVTLAKQVRKVMAAARMNRHEYTFPRIRFVLPNIDGANKDIVILLEQFHRIDPLVNIVIELRDSLYMTRAAPHLGMAIENLKGNDLAGLTSTVNMDHTVLVDMISDLTHLKLEPQPWQAPTTRAQIVEENQHGGLMAKILYRLLANRELVCTREMAEHFHDMLQTVGTKTERERGHLLVPLFDETRKLPAATIRKRFQQLSTYPLPDNIQVPVTVLHEEDWSPAAVQKAVHDGRLPHVALDVARCGDFKSSKLSIYMYGWASGRTTVTSNKEISGQFKTWIETNRHADDERGPAIWKIDVTRNLLAKSATPPPGFFGTYHEEIVGSSDTQTLAQHDIEED